MHLAVLVVAQAAMLLVLRELFVELEPDQAYTDDGETMWGVKATLCAAAYVVFFVLMVVGMVETVTKGPRSSR